MAAEYSKDPVNMNRKQWEKEQSWKDFITGDMLYCRNKAESFEEFVFLMEKLGYEVKVGAHISVKADGMRRSRRLDTLDEEFSLQNLQEYYEQPHPYKYVALPVYQPGYALIKKPKNAFQQRYYGKLYRMCVVQKYRFQYKYTRYQQDLIRMKELQEEYLFLNRTGINGWNDVFDVKRVAERKIADIDAKRRSFITNMPVKSTSMKRVGMLLFICITKHTTGNSWQNLRRSVRKLKVSLEPLTVV